MASLEFLPSLHRSWLSLNLQIDSRDDPLKRLGIKTLTYNWNHMRNFQAKVLESLENSSSSFLIRVSCYQFCRFMKQPYPCVFLNWRIQSSLCWDLKKVLVCHLHILLYFLSINFNHALLNKFLCHSPRAYAHPSKSLRYSFRLIEFFNIWNIHKLVNGLLLLASLVQQLSFLSISLIKISSHKVLVESVKGLKSPFLFRLINLSCDWGSLFLLFLSLPRFFISLFFFSELSLFFLDQSWVLFLKIFSSEFFVHFLVL